MGVYRMTEDETAESVRADLHDSGIDDEEVIA